MTKIIANLANAAALLIGLPAAALFAYDTIAVQPHLARIESILAEADPEDARPPQIIRDLIDADAGSPVPHSARLVTSLVYSGLRQGQWHVRNALWGILLPMHFDESEIYGLYSALSYNGIDHGPSNFARRAYGKPLRELSPMQAATVVAITRAPTLYLRESGRLDRRAKRLLATYRRSH